jgi:hypothetical protein
MYSLSKCKFEDMWILSTKVVEGWIYWEPTVNDLCISLFSIGIAQKGLLNYKTVLYFK